MPTLLEQGVPLPFPRLIARINRYVTNPLLGQLAGRIGPFAMLDHVGRRTGKARRTPIMAFREDGGFLVALTYGPNTDWLHNIRAKGECTIVIRRQRYHLIDPRLIEADPEDMPLPAAIRFFLNIMRVRYFLRLTDKPPG
jgi:deazaflavin-dependent oxidoreductase (nitroreductase family)